MIICKGLAAAGVGVALLASPINLISQEREDSTRFGLINEKSAAVRVLNVPFVAQTEALCGGAAIAMVLRYWGETRVRAEDFATLVHQDEGGIIAGELLDTVRDMGWQAIPFTGTIQEVQIQLSQGRPLIALIESRASRYHYIVLVGWTQGYVLIHDPARGPFRVLRDDALLRAWIATEYWTLLVLPPHKTNSEKVTIHSIKASNGINSYPDECAQLVKEGVQLAREGDLVSAENTLSIAHGLCPHAGVPLRELASIRFRQKRWNEAAQLAEKAIALEPEDAHAWRLLATNRFLNHDLSGALVAWNSIGEPLLDLIHVSGQARTRYTVFTEILDLRSGALLTSDSFRQAKRRLSFIPVVANSRIGYRLLPDGRANVDVFVQERPAFIEGTWDVLGVVTHVLLERELRLTFAGLSGAGEASTLSWRWWDERPRFLAVFEIPEAFGLPGILHIESFWERQAYRTLSHSTPKTFSQEVIIREEHRRTAIHIRDWATADFFWDAALAFDSWQDRGNYLGIANFFETRFASDRLALRGVGELGIPLERDSYYLSGMIGASWRSNPESKKIRWLARLGFSAVNMTAPLGLWPIAGNGHTRGTLLRAHPMFESGVINNKVFGRKLAYGGIEIERWFSLFNFTQFSFGPFIDVARAWTPFTSELRMSTEVDIGSSSRLLLPGKENSLRIDLARSLRGGEVMLSATFELRWPYW